MKPSHEKLRRRLGLKSDSTGLLETALTHRSFGTPNNERLEFLGDSVLGLVISEILFQKFPRSDEGDLSRLRANLVNGETLAEVARRLDFGDELLLGPGELKSGGFRRDSILAGALEAIIGIAWLEGGYDEARAFIARVFEEEIEQASMDQVLKDPKTRLQEYLQGRQQALPDYQVIDTSGSDHDRSFRVECRVDGLSAAIEGEGGSRRKAEQDAAEKALQRLQQGEES